MYLQTHGRYSHACTSYLECRQYPSMELSLCECTACLWVFMGAMQLRPPHQLSAIHSFRLKSLHAVPDLGLVLVETSTYIPRRLAVMSRSSQDQAEPIPGATATPAAEKKYDSEESGTADVQDGVIIDDGLQRALLGRHVSLISLASIIGAGTFYGFGYALYLSGPLGALISYGIVGEFGRPRW